MIINTESSEAMGRSLSLLKPCQSLCEVKKATASGSVVSYFYYSRNEVLLLFRKEVPYRLEKPKRWDMSFEKPKLCVESLHSTISSPLLISKGYFQEWLEKVGLSSGLLSSKTPHSSCRASTLGVVANKCLNLEHISQYFQLAINIYPLPIILFDLHQVLTEKWGA